MKAPTRYLLRALTGAALVASMPVSAADPATWLQRQFSTVHHDPMLVRPVVARANRDEGAESAHAHASQWLQRQLAGAGFPAAVSRPAPGLQGLIYRPDAEKPIYYAWLQRVMTTEHRELGTRL
ncbi:hypothetical protein LLG90_22645 [Aromatoleum toluclasticum]|uniref:hypothetical protein n=1 Tax=Aromatoleum toluclasticum TaxID=92003 RepID=UPI001D193D07|nr:hypothetical protein [Aromatoleum toluclasticum]MCC4118157.1 hypothetical protein [Aromatoleum toluclasticum]